MRFILLSISDNCKKLGDISKSGYYLKVKQGVLPPPVKFGRSRISPPNQQTSMIWPVWKDWTQYASSVINRSNRRLQLKLLIR